MISLARSISRLVAALAAAVLLTSAAAASPATTSTSRYVGRPLVEVLRELRGQGLNLVFTSEVVAPDLRVREEPTATRSHDLLDQLLTPHRLRAHIGPRGILVILPERNGPRRERAKERDDFPSAANDPEGAAPEFVAPTTVFSDQLLVTPSRFGLLEDRATLGLSREEILALPHLGDDFFRAVSLLPGSTSNEFSAQFHVRGGRRDEVRIVLDGQELYDPYHLQDFDRALSLIAPSTLGSAELQTGGFSAEHGDRMGAVLDLATRVPDEARRFHVGLGVLNAQLGGSGKWRGWRPEAERVDAGGREGSWLFEARRGSIDLVGRLLGHDDPRFADGFVRLDQRFGERHSLGARFVVASDTLALTERKVPESDKRFQTEYASSYGWLIHEAIVGSGTLLETAASWARVDRERRGSDDDEDTTFGIDDRRHFRVIELRQRGDAQASARHLLSWGVEGRRYLADYDYRGVREFGNPLAKIRHDFGREATAFAARLRERHDGAFFSDRWRGEGRLSAEFGARVDSYTQTDETRISPRLNLALALGPSSLARLAWGRFEQSQRPNELQVEDGDSTISPVERSEHRVLGFEHAPNVRRSLGVSVVRVELYEKRVKNPRRSYENLFEPLNTFPEVEPDRILIAPKESVARGAELFARGAVGERVGWSASYAYSASRDRIAARWRPRAFDETHAVKLDLDWRVSERTRANFAWRGHSGWPTTRIGLATTIDDDGELEFEPVLGPLHGERLPPYHRLDLRLSRTAVWRGVDVLLFVDAQDVYHRRNVAGYDVSIDEDRGVLVRRPELGSGILPSFGIRFEF